MMFEENESVILTRDIPESALKKGAVGVVAFVYDNGNAYEVEFMDGSRTIGVVTVSSVDLLPKNFKEIIRTERLSGGVNYNAFGTAYYPLTHSNQVESSDLITFESDKKDSSTDKFYQIL